MHKIERTKGMLTKYNWVRAGRMDNILRAEEYVEGMSKGYWEGGHDYVHVQP